MHCIQFWDAYGRFALFVDLDESTQEPEVDYGDFVRMFLKWFNDDACWIPTGKVLLAGIEDGKKEL